MLLGWGAGTLDGYPHSHPTTTDLLLLLVLACMCRKEARKARLREAAGAIKSTGKDQQVGCSLASVLLSLAWHLQLCSFASRLQLCFFPAALPLVLAKQRCKGWLCSRRAHPQPLQQTRPVCSHWDSSLVDTEQHMC